LILIEPRINQLHRTLARMAKAAIFKGRESILLTRTDSYLAVAKLAHNIESFTEMIIMKKEKVSL